jgi:hypothetical protein
MLSIDIIESKSFFTNSNTGQTYLDLVTCSWDSRQVSYGLKSIAIVTEETQMRADLLSLLYQGSSNGLGTLLKVNNISNPLSIKVGEVLGVPSDAMKKDLFKGGQKLTNQKQKAKSFRKELQEKISQVSKGRLEYLNSKNISNLAETPLPPNILQAGQKQINVADGKILFGPDIGHCRTNSPKNVSVSDIKSRIANKNIFKR